LLENVVGCFFLPSSVRGVRERARDELDLQVNEVEALMKIRIHPRAFMERDYML
jgi:hypothetical protein